jgi:hypothetical protein
MLSVELANESAVVVATNEGVLSAQFEESSD